MPWRTIGGRRVKVEPRRRGPSRGAENAADREAGIRYVEAAVPMRDSRTLAEEMREQFERNRMENEAADAAGGSYGFIGPTADAVEAAERRAELEHPGWRPERNGDPIDRLMRLEDERRELNRRLGLGTIGGPEVHAARVARDQARLERVEEHITAAKRRTPARALY
jgi:hypothetical protein